MAKSLLMLLGVAGIGGASYVYWQQLAPHLPPQLPHLPPQLVSAIESLPLPGVGGSSDKAATRRSTPAAADAKEPPSKKGAGQAPVNVAVAQLSEMPIVLSAPGTVEAMATVALKSRVDGQVVEVGFKEGDMVEAGAVLYRLDDRLVGAQIKQAEATITRDQASLKDAMSIMERRESLLLKKYASEAATETARQQVEVLKANIAAGRALLDMQRTQMDYLVIRAPITGRTGSMTAKLGSFVRSADPLALVTINQTKPITVAFALPQSNLQQLKTALASRSTAVIMVAGATPIVVNGILNFVDNQIDKTTGTVTAKVMVVNADETLWPGQAVTVDLTVETRKDVVSVPASAVLPAQDGMITWVIGAGNTVSVRTVVQERVIGQQAFIASGLQAGERVVSDGQLRLSPGATVSIRETPSRPGAAPAAAEAGKGKGKGGQTKDASGKQSPATEAATSSGSGG